MTTPDQQAADRQDLVRRLRAERFAGEFIVSGASINLPICREAADTIESQARELTALRAEVAAKDKALRELVAIADQLDHGLAYTDESAARSDAAWAAARAALEGGK